MTSKAHRAVSLIVLFAALLMVFSAQAQEFLKDYSKPLPNIPFLPEAEFTAATNLYEDTPFGDKALAFEIRAPKNWQKQKEAENSAGTAAGGKLLGDLAQFYGPPNLDVRSFMKVQALKLEYQLTGEQWFIQWLLANSYTLQGIKVHDDKRVEAIYIYVEGDTTYAVRAIAQVNGKRVVMAQYFLPTDSWDTEKKLQAQVISSFEIKNPVEEYVEPMEKYHFLDISEFMYPSSWQLKSSQLKSIDRLQAEMLSIASEEEVKNKKFKLLNGKMAINLISFNVVDSLKDEVENFKKKIKDSGLEIQDFVEMKDNFGLNPSMDSRPVEIYKVMDLVNKGLAYELWFLVMAAGDYYYFATLLTPSRDEDYYIWSRNTQTFRLVVKTIIPLEGSLVGN